jgi:Fe-S-cluster-containing hydrogenase component 2
MLKPKRSLCTECQICMEICSQVHYGESNPKRSRIRVEAEWPETPFIRVCLACKGHECVPACPHDALEWDGWVRVDKTLCDSCGACMEACPVKGIRMDPVTALPLICDTCQGAFQCVDWCPTKAIERIG